MHYFSLLTSHPENLGKAHFIFISLERTHFSDLTYYVHMYVDFKKIDLPAAIRDNINKSTIFNSLYIGDKNIYISATLDEIVNSNVFIPNFLAMVTDTVLDHYDLFKSSKENGAYQTWRYRKIFKNLFAQSKGMEKCTNPGDVINFKFWMKGHGHEKK